MPNYIDDDSVFCNLTTKESKELDDLATLKLEPDKKFLIHYDMFFSQKKFKILNTSLVLNKEHIRI